MINETIVKNSVNAVLETTKNDISHHKIAELLQADSAHRTYLEKDWPKSGLTSD